MTDLSPNDTLVAWRREADYWQKRVERSDDQAAGLLTACLTVAGVVTLIGRIWSSPLTRLLTGALPHGELADEPTYEQLLALERNHARTGMKLAKVRETGVGLALIAFAVGVVMIAYAGSEALDAPTPPAANQPR